MGNLEEFMECLSLGSFRNKTDLSLSKAGFS